ncbi:MAG: polysaccharide deacetylase family protein [Candidatus Riflebacteria bacterium]|nr:polysaccharide deacetylase family protein [Candidatus Riflebacteria bacterium]
MPERSIPVLYYHRIGTSDSEHLSTSAAMFEKQMRFMHSHGYKTIGLDKLLGICSGRDSCSEKYFMITFDDGFYDNLANAHEILNKFSFKGIVFACSGLVRPENQRPSTEISFNEAHKNTRKGDFSAFLSEKEISEMYKSGVWDFYSHTHSHNQVFTSSKIVSVFPDKEDHWGIISAYNASSDNVSNELVSLMKNKASLPVFERKPGLLAEAFFPKISEISKSFSSNSSEKIFSLLNTKIDEKRYFFRETNEDYFSRVNNELTCSRNFFKKYHSSKSDSICWPWGKYHFMLTEMADKAGFDSAFSTKSGANSFGTNPFEICRFPVKKNSLFRFSIGILLRSYCLSAKLYGFFHGKI